MTLKQLIRTIPHYPKPGIMFRDITTLLKDATGFKLAIETLAQRYSGAKPDKVAGIESRGFIIGGALASRLGLGFVPIRKPGKLPSKTQRENYALEYGVDGLEIHEDAFRPGQRVLIVDDVLATGGTAKAAAELVKRVGGELVGLSFFIELNFLSGRTKLNGEVVHSVLQY